MDAMRIGVLTGGGDVPGLNPCIKAVVDAASARGWEITGFLRGWAGVLSIDPGALDFTCARGAITLTPARVRGIDREGGTILHTSRTDPRRAADGDRTQHVLDVIAALRLDAIVTLGGDGTLKFSAHLAKLGVPVIAVPKTMDNDVHGTDYCLGFSTAVTRSVDAINALRTTCASHERIGVIELFGRRSGETALVAGLLAGADRIAIAESLIDADALTDLLVADRAANPDRYAMLVVSEGAALAGDADSSDIGKSHTARHADAIGTRLARHIEARGKTGTVIQELAYLMRSGSPDAVDRMVGLSFGQLAVQLLAAGESGRLLAVRDGNYSHLPIASVEAASRRVDVANRYDPASYRAVLRAVDGLPMFLA
jgi:ATP-dependent phosphofructokinase / diphosphate-dependent phosphofructokinase